MILMPWHGLLSVIGGNIVDSMRSMPQVLAERAPSAEHMGVNRASLAPPLEALLYWCFVPMKAGWSNSFGRETVNTGLCLG